LKLCGCGMARISLTDIGGSAISLSATDGLRQDLGR
jgi:hypothetical protein